MIDPETTYEVGSDGLDDKRFVERASGNIKKEEPVSRLFVASWPEMRRKLVS
jgi:hypothetical protein